MTNPTPNTMHMHPNPLNQPQTMCFFCRLESSQVVDFISTSQIPIIPILIAHSLRSFARVVNGCPCYESAQGMVSDRVCSNRTATDVFALPFSGHLQLDRATLIISKGYAVVLSEVGDQRISAHGVF
jgi:hypothetical protein